MKKIRLTQGKFALVDDDMFGKLNQFKWCAHKSKKTYYAERAIRIAVGKQAIIKMHHEIIGKPPIGFMIDHIAKIVKIRKILLKLLNFQECFGIKVEINGGQKFE